MLALLGQLLLLLLLTVELLLELLPPLQLFGGFGWCLVQPSTDAPSRALLMRTVRD
jgi:hypothetical protein